MRVTCTHAVTASRASSQTPGGHPAEQRRAVGGALVDHGRLERHPEHRGDDLQPQLRARAAARDAPHARAPAELLDEVQRVAQREGHALEHRAREGAAVVAQAEPGERAARGRVGVRRALARQVGREEQPLDPGLPVRRAAEQLVVRCPPTVSRSHCSEPAALSITPMTCHACGTAWQKACTRASGSCA